jgi:hypothetical protein
MELRAHIEVVRPVGAGAEANKTRSTNFSWGMQKANGPSHRGAKTTNAQQ